MAVTNLIGTDQQQAYFNDYNIPPRGYGFMEPGVVAPDSNDFVAFSVAKSFYQVYPEVFNIGYVAKKTGLKADDIKKRLQKMYRANEMMLVYNPAVSLMGYGLYYWTVKLTKDVTPEERENLTKWFQNNDQICTGYEMEPGGDFDYFNGNHMRNIDNLLGGVIDKFRSKPYVEYVHLCPVRRVVRVSQVNQFDSKKDYRKYFWDPQQLKNLLKFQNKMDKNDFAIIDTLNNTASIGDMFDFDVLANLSGLDAAEMKQNLTRVVDSDRSMLPMIYLDYRSLGLKLHFYIVSLFENTPTWRSEQICDEFAEDPRFVNIMDFGDAHHNMMLAAYEGISDLDEIKKKILSYGEVTEVLEASSPRQFRRWTCRLDGDNGFWEECVFTDDVLQDRSRKDAPVAPCCTDKEAI